MYTLLIDTHNTNINLVLYKEKKVVDHMKKESLKSHSVYVMSMIDKLILNNNINKDDIKEIIVVNGPGSFTGIRIGITIAKTWAFCKNIKIKSITSLEIIAASINNKKDKVVAIADPKGFYIGEFDENTKQKKEYEYYLKTKAPKNFILEDDVQIDYDLVYKYSENIAWAKPHVINPIYIKKIGVENG